jgi:hypothetical protein
VVRVFEESNQIAEKNKSQEGSISPPPEEINIRMPEMSALIVKEPSMLNDSAQFCLDEIFQSSQKKKGDSKKANLGFSEGKKGTVDNMNMILSQMDSNKIPSG